MVPRLDHIFASEPVYSYARAINSAVQTNHKAVILRADQAIPNISAEITSTHQYRSCSPGQHAALLERIFLAGTVRM